MDIEQVKAIHREAAERNASYVWHNIAMIAMAEHVVCVASDEILDVNDISPNEKERLEESRTTCLQYIDNCKEILRESVEITEDMMLDFFFHVEKQTKRKLKSFFTAVKKNAKMLGVKSHTDPICHLALSMKLLETLFLYSKMTKQMPWYRYIKKNSPSDRALCLLQYSYRHMSKMLDILDSEEHRDPEPNPAIDKMFNDIIDVWNNNDLYLNAIKYVEKEKKKAEKAK